MAITDYPKADIQTERWMAKLLRWIGLVWFILGAFIAGYSMEHGVPEEAAEYGIPVEYTVEMGLLLAGFGLLSIILSVGSRVTALEWEVNDVHHSDTASERETGSEGENTE